MILTENLPLEGKIKVSLANFTENSCIVKKNEVDSTSLITLKNNFNSGFLGNPNFLATGSIAAPVIGIATDGYKFIAVGNTSSAFAIASSIDGKNWNTITNIFAFPYQGITYANGLWVIFGQSSQLATSTDGENWTFRDGKFSPSSIIYSVAYGNGMWVAGGQFGQVSISYDGINWNAVSIPSISTKTIQSVAYGNGLWVIGGASGTLAKSTNGTDWTLVESGFGASSILSIAFCKDKWLIGGSAGKLAISTDSTNWTLIDCGFSTNIIYSILYVHGTYFVGGQNGLLAVSNNLTTWKFETLLVGTAYIYAMTYSYDLGILLVGTTASKINMSYYGYFYDIYSKTDTNYIYSLIPIIGGSEGTPQTSAVTSVFCRSFLCDANHAYDITNELSYNDFEQVQLSGINDTYGARTPTVHTFGTSNYIKGTLSFYQIPAGEGVLNQAVEVARRKEIISFLTNKKAKIIKDLNGNIWLVAFYGGISFSAIKEIGNGAGNISASFVAIGAADSQSDLEKVGLLDKFILYI